jgi:signal transduction histidine kinase/CheY-like chemotaxis protein
MTPIRSQRRFQDKPALYAAIAAIVAGVFAIDLATYLGLADWVMYFAAVALSMLAPRTAVPAGVAVTCAALIAVGYWLSPAPPVEELQRVAQLNRAIAAGTLLAFGAIGRQFVATRLRLACQEWVRAGQTGLAARMQGELAPGELGRNILGFLAEYVGAPVGSVYVAGDGGALMRQAGFALGGVQGEPGEPGETVKPGETLVGQAAAGARALVIHDLPAGYAEVRSGVGRASPRALALVPTTADGAVNGVVELGFFAGPPRLALELLEAIAEPVGIALRSAVYRKRQAELLEETRRQAEELQAQQEELTAANEELEEQQASLEQANAQLEAQAEDLTTTHAVLRQKASELERASRYKSEFLANMSHELRTPLNSSLILARLLADNRDGNLTPEQVQYAESIYAAGNDLLALINDILDLSKIEAGKLELDIAQIPIARVFDKLARRFEPLARQKHLELAVAIDPACPQVIETDEQRLQQILTNLISNAIKFTDKGAVRLHAGPAEHAGHVAFVVEDTGIGIPPHQHAVIFEAFRQADGTTSRKYGGTGLGLSISRELATRLGGEIRLVSAPGEGSRFSVVLPSRPQVAAPPVRRRTTSMAALPAARPPEPAPLARPVIEDDRRQVTAQPSRAVLVIEDDVAFAAILRDLAREMEFQCVVAHGADEGIRLARELRPVAIILDVSLPDHSGLTVLELLKRDPATRHTPIHIVSAHDHQHVAREMGAIGYTLKPVKREDLAATFAGLKAQLSRKTKAVLVIEDDEVQRGAIAKLLGAEDVAIAAVADAGGALELLRRETFDCVVLDLMLPAVSGFELLERMSEDETCSFPPVIVYTARPLSLEDEQRLRRFSRSVIVKGARSPERLLEEVTLFLHQVESDLPPDKQRMLHAARHRESLFDGRRVLLVEDDVRNIFALSSLLEPKGMKLDIARNGKEALDRLAKAPPVDLVLMDIMMPEMNGLDAMRRLRADERWKGLPVIALTAKAMPDDRAECIGAGASDYIAKPIESDKLLSLLRVWMPK